MRALGLALAGLACAGLAAAAAGVEVEGSACRMTLRADNEPLTNVLAAIEAATGVEIEARGALDRRVSMKLVDRSVDHVLDRLGLSVVRICEAQVSTEVHRMDAEILSLAVNHWAYTGGAHGITSDRHVGIDLRTGRRLALAELFAAGFEERLTALIKEELRRGKGLPTGASLEEAGFWEKDIAPAENFFVDAEGVGFRYNPYDIAAYAAGSFSPVIPFAKLRDLLVPEMRRRLAPAE
jgi:hypothetical protein